MTVSSGWGAAPQAELVSPDGYWRWTGSQWLPIKGRDRHHWPRRVAVRLLVVGLVLLAISGILLGFFWSRDLGAVHRMVGPGQHKIQLRQGPYWVYEDPNGDAPLPFSADQIHVIGPAGRVDAQTVPFGVIRPGLTAAPFQGTGLFMPVAKFVADYSGAYSIRVAQLPETDVSFVAPSQVRALLAVLPWIFGTLIGLIVTIVGLLSLRSNNRVRRLTAP